MNTATLKLPALSNARPADERIGFRRLVGVELRKCVNSRGAFWFAMAIAAATFAMLLSTVFGGGEADQTVTKYFENGSILLGTLLPIVALLLVSTEWTQRSAMTTLAQQPRRRQLLLSKLAASMVVALIAIALCIAASFAVGLFAANDTAGAMALDRHIAGQSMLMIVFSVVMGFGFGAAFLRSAPAIVGYLLFPSTVLLIGTIEATKSAIAWIDLGAASEPVTEKAMTTTEWKYFLVSSFVWMVVPLAVGWWRVLRDEVG